MDREQLTRMSENHIRALLRALLPDTARVFIYGSRARGDQRWNSDYDLWIDGLAHAAVLAEIAEQLDESFVPFKVDLVTTERLKGRFGERVRAEARRWA